MKHILASVGLCLAFAVTAIPTANAQDAKGSPQWMQQTYPEKAVKSALAEMQAIEGPGALDEKTKQLIGLGVSAQIPCQYCVYYHTKMAKAEVLCRNCRIGSRAAAEGTRSFGRQGCSPVTTVNLSRNSGCASSFPSRRDSGEYLHTKACDELV
jgi:alkylhydroperoxidase/carboxymuconolactone decarboxylase family protein YurZ